MGKPAYPSGYRGTGADLRMVGPSGPVRTYRLSPEELAELEARLPSRQPPEKRPRFVLGQWSRRRAQEVDKAVDNLADTEAMQTATAETSHVDKGADKPAGADGVRTAQTPPELTRETLARVMREHPEWTGADLGRYFGLSAGTFYDLVSKRGISLRALRLELGLPDLTGRMRGRGSPAHDRRPDLAAVIATTERYEMRGRFELSLLAARLKALESMFGSAAVATVRIEIMAGREAVGEEA